MGFYSIYKIFKDMIKTLFGKGFLKILIIFIFLFLAYVIFASKGVFAATTYDFTMDYYYNEFSDTVMNTIKSIDRWSDSTYSVFAYTQGNPSTSRHTVMFIKNYYNAGYYLNNNTVGFTANNWWGDTYHINPNGSIADYGRNQHITWSHYDNVNSSSVFLFRNLKLTDNSNYLEQQYFVEPYIEPYIENTTEEIEQWDFDYLLINLGDYNPYYTYIDFLTLRTFDLEYTYNNITYSMNVDNYFEQITGQFYIKIPITALTDNINIRNDSTISFNLKASGRFVSPDNLPLGDYTLTLTTGQEEEINEDSSKYVQGQILEQQQQTNQKLDNLDNTINNSNIDNITNDTLPSDDTQDITASGVNGIFSSIYNAFCIGNPQDIVFPIPFTDKNITLSPYYVSNMLTTSNASWVITIIQAFWWYLISRFIIKDVMNKINKIKSGEIEEIETTNIRGDML